MREITGERQVFGRWRHFIQGAVNAVTNLEFVFKRLEMNVTGAVLNCLEQDQIHKSHDGRLARQFLQGRGPTRFCRRLDDFRGSQLRLHVFQDIFQGLALFAKESEDCRFNLFRGRDGQLHVLAEDEGKLADKLGIIWIHHGHCNGIPGDGNGHRAIHAGHAAGHDAQHGLVDVDVLEIQVLEVQVLGYGAQQLFFAEQSEIDDDLRKRLTGALVLLL